MPRVVAQLGHHWRKVQKLKPTEEEPDVVAAQNAFATTWVYPEKGGADAARDVRKFNLDEEMLIKTACDYAGQGGFPMRKSIVSEIMNSVLVRACYHACYHHACYHHACYHACTQASTLAC